jgi:hypothetical protein
LIKPVKFKRGLISVLSKLERNELFDSLSIEDLIRIHFYIWIRSRAWVGRSIVLV